MVRCMDKKMAFRGRRLIDQRQQSAIGFEIEFCKPPPFKSAYTQDQLRSKTKTPHFNAEFLPLLLARQNKYAVCPVGSPAYIKKIINVPCQPRPQTHGANSTVSPGILKRICLVS